MIAGYVPASDQRILATESGLAAVAAYRLGVPLTLGAQSQRASQSKTRYTQGCQETSTVTSSTVASSPGTVTTRG
jgi:hypothetical protein